jgi:hypothetical protein
MAVLRPFRRTARQFSDGPYWEEGRSRYIDHPLFAEAREHYIRAFLLIQKDLQTLFDYVEPSDRNLQCHSFRIHELLLRACVEVEANCKAILRENGYPSGEWKMRDYRKLDASHRLSSYRVRLPVWRGVQSERRPFAAWAAGGALPWYSAYNSTKHDRHEAFDQATFQQLTDAACGLVALLTAQFLHHESPGKEASKSGQGHYEVFISAIGGYFEVKMAFDWPQEERYLFNWNELATLADPFDSFDYSNVS